ncbi:MAG: class I SAM-dependent methyltransferase [Firmicutes bacterium]|nr:class I SAM-dependent methyltransferase [Bacillota bacterium]
MFVALHGCTAIAGDISNVMLKLLLEKAPYVKLTESQLIPCRMNALSVPLADDFVDGAVANAILHLISEPTIVIRELWRV